MTSPVSLPKSARQSPTSKLVIRSALVERIGGRNGWNDMVEFAERLPDAQLSERLLQTIRGKGPFRCPRWIAACRVYPEYANVDIE